MNPKLLLDEIKFKELQYRMNEKLFAAFALFFLAEAAGFLGSSTVQTESRVWLERGKADQKVGQSEPKGRVERR